ncbi:MAG TPA: M28 family peptidase [Gemmataceae bacterium]|nr:M28 family peptidase [Gemmataceae bacterium]
MPKKLAGLSVLVVALLVRADAPPKSSLARMRADLTFLASDACEGRGPGTAGIDKAADYITAAFRAAGLKGAMPDGSFFQPFTVRGNPTLAPGAGVALTGPNGETKNLKHDEDFQAIGLSGSGTVTAPIVFAGYGVSCPEPAYDDYHGLDVAGKIVLMIRKLPRFGDKDHPFADDQTVQQHAALQTKIANAEKHKAAAVILVNDAAENDDPLMEFAYASGAAGNIPAVQVKRSVADQMLKSALNASLADIEKAIAKDLTPAGANLRGWSATVSLSVERAKIPVKNVVGVLDGAGPLANETVVIGAHYDHLGYGGRGTGSLSTDKHSIHHGADDNGSGTTALIDLARRFGADKERQGRRLVFIAFSGEELGLLGSKHYCDHPLFPLESTVAMVNMDMVGRLVADPNTGKGKLEIGGTGTAKGFDGLIDKLNAVHGFEVKKNKAGVAERPHVVLSQRRSGVFPLHRPA